MTVESYYAIAIATFSDWNKNQQRGAKPVAPCTRSFPRTLGSELQVNARNFGRLVHRAVCSSSG